MVMELKIGWKLDMLLDFSLLTISTAENDVDGISNGIELKIGSDPLTADHQGSGLYYTYDKLGRIKAISRVPVN